MHTHAYIYVRLNQGFQDACFRDFVYTPVGDICTNDARTPDDAISADITCAWIQGKTISNNSERGTCLAKAKLSPTTPKKEHVQSWDTPGNLSAYDTSGCLGYTRQTIGIRY